MASSGIAAEITNGDGRTTAAMIWIGQLRCSCRLPAPASVTNHMHHRQNDSPTFGDEAIGGTKLATSKGKSTAISTDINQPSRQVDANPGTANRTTARSRLNFGEYRKLPRQNIPGCRTSGKENINSAELQLRVITWERKDCRSDQTKTNGR